MRYPREKRYYVLIFAANMTCLKVRYARSEILCMVQMSSRRGCWVKEKLSQKRIGIFVVIAGTQGLQPKAQSVP